MRNEKLLKAYFELYKETKNPLFLNMFTFTSRTNVPIMLDGKINEQEDDLTI